VPVVAIMESDAEIANVEERFAPRRISRCHRQTTPVPPHAG
jgi:hypothetical protein